MIFLLLYLKTSLTFYVNSLIWMKCQALFSVKMRKNVFYYHLLLFKVCVLTLVLLNKLRCHATSNFHSIRLLDPGFQHKVTYLMTNSAEPDQLASYLCNFVSCNYTKNYGKLYQSLCKFSRWQTDFIFSSEANWSGSTLFVKVGYIRVQQDKG